MSRTKISSSPPEPISLRKYRNLGLDVDLHCAHCGAFLTTQFDGVIQQPDWTCWTGQCWRPTDAARQRWLALRTKVQRRPTKDECIDLKRGVFMDERPDAPLAELQLPTRMIYVACLRTNRLVPA